LTVKASAIIFDKASKVYLTPKGVAKVIPAKYRTHLTPRTASAMVISKAHKAYTILKNGVGILLKPTGVGREVG